MILRNIIIYLMVMFALCVLSLVLGSLYQTKKLGNSTADGFTTAPVILSGIVFGILFLLGFRFTITK